MAKQKDDKKYRRTLNHVTVIFEDENNVEEKHIILELDSKQAAQWKDFQRDRVKIITLDEGKFDFEVLKNEGYYSFLLGMCLRKPDKKLWTLEEIDALPDETIVGLFWDAMLLNKFVTPKSDGKDEDEHGNPKDKSPEKTSTGTDLQTN